MNAYNNDALQRLEVENDSRMEQQVDNLRDKMRLLQNDRKSHIDTLEATKRTNKEYIKQLKNENRELRAQLADIRKSEQGMNYAGVNDLFASTATSMGAAGAIGNSMEELGQALVQLNKARKHYDELKHRVQSQTAVLEELKDSIKDLELEAKKPSMEDTPETRKIRMLENRLDKAMIKYNEAQSICKTYEQIVKRLRDERIGFDNQLSALERALEAKNHDFEELSLLSSDAIHARDMIMQELEHARSQFEEEKRNREKEYRSKQQYVKIRMEMSQRLDKHEKTKAEIIAKESGDLTNEEEEHLKSALGSLVANQDTMKEEKKEHRSKIDIFEAAFRKIKEATGVSDVNEVIQKIFSQESTTENLMNLSKENQTRMETLQVEYANLKARVEELKYAGSGGGHHRKMVDDHEQSLILATARLERAKLKHERLNKILIGVKAGVEHLCEKTEGVRDGDQVVTVSDETIAETLRETEITLVRLMNTVQSVNCKSKIDQIDINKSEASDAKTKLADIPIHNNGESLPVVQGSSLADSEVLLARPYNQRISLPLEGLTSEEIEQDENIRHNLLVSNMASMSTLLEDQEDALSRDRVKKASSQVIQAQDKKKKKLTKKGVRTSSNDSDEDDGAVTTAGTGSGSVQAPTDGKGRCNTPQIKSPSNLQSRK